MTLNLWIKGLCVYLETHIENSKERGICIGYDGRYRSRRFALITASTFISRGFKVYLFKNVVPTPILAYSTFNLNCSAGVMVTASHNPKDDNGYKVYGDNGCQIIEPADSLIREAIYANLEPWSKELDEAFIEQHVVDPSYLFEKYFEEVQSKWCFYKSTNSSSTLRITYTAMHGVGSGSVNALWKAFGLNPLFITEAQNDPNPDFPTVVFPNPEEGKGSLKLAMETADNSGSTLILANDPDADRLAVAEKDGDSWRLFTGNEIGILLADWVVRHFKERNPSIPAEKMLILNSTVSSKMISSLARKLGIQYDETLTGFKWLGNRAIDAKKNGMYPIFAFEEAIGYSIGDTCWDKDGVSAACVFGEMASTLQQKGLTCAQRLVELQKEYGVYLTKNSYFFCYEPEKITMIFDEIRNGGKYVDACGEFQVSSIRDLTTPGYDSLTADHKPTMPVSASTQMITFTFVNGAVATLRGSGTEPKLKYYVELFGDGDADPKMIQKQLDQLVSDIIQTCLKPEKYGLIPSKE